MLSISRVLINYTENPSGVLRRPTIGWTLESERRGLTQRSYRLMISPAADFSSCVYDSGTVHSEESAHVQPDFELESITKYYVRVEVCDSFGESACGEGSFISACQSPDEFRGRFISVESEADRDSSFGSYLRKEFQIEGEIQSAYLVASAHGLYTAYLNGAKIGEDFFTPGWTSYNKHLLYQTYEITKLLKSGYNTIGVELGAGWYKGKMSFNLNRNHYGTRSAFGGHILVNYADGGRAIFASDSSWKGSRSPILFSEIYDGETYDARLEQRGWNSCGFDESAWQAAEELEQDLSVLSPSRGAGVQIMNRLSPKALINTPEGDTVLDFGQNLTGWCRFNIDGAKPGDMIILQFFESLDAKGNVYTANLRTAKQTITYTCAGGSAVYQPSFSFQGFRYAHIIRWPGTPELRNFTACVLHTGMESTGHFSCSYPLLNKLQHNIVWSMKGNFLDVPTDCPQRDERLGWTGDVQIFNSTASFLMNTYAFFAKWLRDVECDQSEEGAVAHVVPDIISGKSADDWLTKQGCSGASAWADVDILLPWNLYLAYGDTDIIRRQYSSMKRWIDFMTANSSEGCLFDYKLQFGDWVALDAQEGSYFGATPTAFTSAAFYCHSCDIFSRMAKIIGEAADALQYAELAQSLRQDFIGRFFTPEGRLTAQTQTAHIVALHFDLIPDGLRAKIAARLKELLDEKDGHLVSGFIGTPYFCHALSDNGYTADAYSLLLKEDYPSWLYQVKMGATTVWEHWDGIKPDGSMWSEDMNSFNHYSYGSVGDWMYKNIGGLRIDEQMPGYKHFFIQPKLDARLSSAEISYQSLYGGIKSAWSRDGDLVALSLTVPANTTADIILDDVAELLAADGALFDIKDSRARATLGSGRYEIHYSLIQ